MECIKKIFWVLTTPLNYLFYKLYVFFSYLTYSEVPLGHIQFMGFLLLLNIATFFWGIFDISPAFWMVIISFFLIIPYSFAKIEDKVIARYSKETTDSQIIGNIVIISYIVSSIVLFILVIRANTR